MLLVGRERVLICGSQIDGHRKWQAYFIRDMLTSSKSVLGLSVYACVVAIDAIFWLPALHLPGITIMKWAPANSRSRPALAILEGACALSRSTYTS